MNAWLIGSGTIRSYDLVGVGSRCGLLGVSVSLWSSEVSYALAIPHVDIVPF